jgi:Asp-tRNA(Asn)/Glu-tRNA(Gln) amidotransferase B subunit
MTAKNVLKIMIEEAGGRLASDIVEEKGWKKVGDESTLREMCLNLMDKNPDKVRSTSYDYRLVAFPHGMTHTYRTGSKYQER